MSTEFLLKALVDIKKEEKSKEERLKDTESKLKSPTVNIHNCGGGRLNVLGHITVDTS